MRKKEKELSQEDLEELERREDEKKWAEIDRQWLASLPPAHREAELRRRAWDARMQEESRKRMEDETGWKFDVRGGKILSVDFPVDDDEVPVKKRSGKKGKGK